MGWLIDIEVLKILVVSFSIGIVVGLTGMGGGALMTPALLLLGIDAKAAVANDLVAAAINKSVGASVHWRKGTPNLKLAGFLMIGSVPMAFAGAFIIKAVGSSEQQTDFVKMAIGVALLLTACTYALRIVIQLRETRRGGGQLEEDPVVRPLPTIAIGAFGGLLVGITSVGAGSLIMVALVLLYPQLNARRLVGTDLVQAVPLVLSAAISHVLVTGVDKEVLVPLIVGGTPGTFLGSHIASRVPMKIIRRGIVIVLSLTGLALLKVPPYWVGGIGVALIVALPFVWAAVRRQMGVPPTVEPIEEESFP